MAVNTSRNLTLLLFIGVGIGSLMPEFGNLLAIKMGLQSSHYFNKYFLLVGILGIGIFGWALSRG